MWTWKRRNGPIYKISNGFFRFFSHALCHAVWKCRLSATRLTIRQQRKTQHMTEVCSSSKSARAMGSPFTLAGCEKDRWRRWSVVLLHFDIICMISTRELVFALLPRTRQKPWQCVRCGTCSCSSTLRLHHSIASILAAVSILFHLTSDTLYFSQSTYDESVRYVRTHHNQIQYFQKVNKKNGFSLGLRLYLYFFRTNWFVRKTTQREKKKISESCCLLIYMPLTSQNGTGFRQYLNIKNTERNSGADKSNTMREKSRETREFIDALSRNIYICVIHRRCMHRWLIAPVPYVHSFRLFYRNLSSSVSLETEYFWWLDLSHNAATVARRIIWKWVD